MSVAEQAAKHCSTLSHIVVYTREAALLVAFEHEKQPSLWLIKAREAPLLVAFQAMIPCSTNCSIRIEVPT